MLERGDVCWTEQPGLGRRPVVVVSTRVVSAALRPIVAAITTTDRARRIPTTVPVAAGEVPGLDRDSWVLGHELLTLDAEVPLEPAGRLSPTRMLEVEDALRVALGLS
jgi:mRNA-degrading endonuclease toxin of MazEF toxin-antitoxin module